MFGRSTVSSMVSGSIFSVYVLLELQDICVPVNLALSPQAGFSWFCQEIQNSRPGYAKLQAVQHAMAKKGSQGNPDFSQTRFTGASTKAAGDKFDELCAVHKLSEGFGLVKRGGGGGSHQAAGGPSCQPVCIFQGCGFADTICRPVARKPE
jgi:hypothetical protein